ncbi:hypothetical protein GCM10007868_30760 [Gluconobacter frateurii]|uniref:Uncharacterized protein n=1 Tax=Gluconobacter frateurii NRIC 0228 TaxID=1307946 RepID=A0ABQ0QDA4_9PROT|nr:hypothetical protein AA0228_2171 [Gluconobacter frateurii NRIC 0228]GLP92001.1 hypothetical protein GCM10007868_30760 [Gluconobacter frateurii]
MGGKAHSLISQDRDFEKIRLFRFTIMKLTQILNWPNKAFQDPYSLFNVPLDELVLWYYHAVNEKNPVSKF